MQEVAMYDIYAISEKKQKYLIELEPHSNSGI